MNNLAVYDFEVLSNHVSVDFKLYDAGSDNSQPRHIILEHEVTPRADVESWFDYIFKNFTLVGFNSLNYDDIMLAAMIRGMTPLEMYNISQAIIVDRVTKWNIVKQYGFYKELERFDSFDIMPILAGKAGLKLYGARIHTQRLEELPVDPQQPVPEDMKGTLMRYGSNDTDVTRELVDILMPQIDLRLVMGKKYNIDLRSKSAPQIAETVLVREFLKIAELEDLEVPLIGSEYIPTTMQYRRPGWVEFQTEKYSNVLNTLAHSQYELNLDSGHIVMPAEVSNMVVPLEDSHVKLGIGGMHSIDNAGHYRAEEGHVLMDIDVASMYPSMIINAGWYPEHMGPAFLDIYKKIVDDRLAAKAAGNKDDAESLKLVVNSSFGQFSNKYSKLYCPNLLLDVTLTGQMTLLMLIEALELAGFYIISANTDGIILSVRCEDADQVECIVNDFEIKTNLKMEYTYYTYYVRRDVNNYFAITEDNEVKGKGIFQVEDDDVSHNPTNNIIAKSIIAYFKHDIPVDESIGCALDIRDFLTVRTVNGGAYIDHEIYNEGETPRMERTKIGKVVRWYYSKTRHGAIHYLSNGNMVPKSQGGQPLMDIPVSLDLPADIDLDKYMEDAKDALAPLLRRCIPGRNYEARKLQESGLNVVPHSHTGVTLVREGYDFSSTEQLAIQTGHRAKTISVSNELFSFDDKNWPQKYANASKKLGYEVIYGGAVSVPHSVYTNPEGIQPLPDDLWYEILNALTKAQQRKITGGAEWLI